MMAKLLRVSWHQKPEFAYMDSHWLLVRWIVFKGCILTSMTLSKNNHIC